MQLGRIFGNYLATQKNYYSIYQIFDRFYYKQKSIKIKTNIIEQISMMSTKDLQFVNEKITKEIVNRKNIEAKMRFELLLRNNAKKQ